MSLPDWYKQACELRDSGLTYKSVARELDADVNADQVRWVLNRERGVSSIYGRLDRTCRACGTSFEVRRSEAWRGGGKYCSRECWRTSPPKWTEKRKREFAKKLPNREGPRNPNYRGGDSDSAVYRRFSLRIKGEQSCRNCGSVQWLHLHHVIPRSMYRAGRYEIRNGLPLCARCHRGWHVRDITIYRDVFTKEEWEWLSSVELQGQNMEAWLDDRYPEPVLEVAA